MYNKATLQWEEMLSRIKDEACIVDTSQWTVLLRGPKQNRLLNKVNSGSSIKDLVGPKAFNELHSELTKGPFYQGYFNRNVDKSRWMITATTLAPGEALLVFCPIDTSNIPDAIPADENAQLDRAKQAEEVNEILRLEIRKHQETQKKLLKAQQHAANIIDSSMNIVIALDEKWRVREFNKSAERVLGIKKKDILGTSISSFIEDGDMKVVNKDVVQKGHFQGEVNFHSKKGSKRLLLGVSRLLGENDQGTVWSMKDLTALKQSEATLAAKASDYADLLENASDLIQGLTSEGTILYVNKSWKKKLGYGAGEIAGMSFYDIVHEEDREDYKAYLQGILNGKKAITKLWRLNNKAGNTILVESNDNVKVLQDRSISIRSIMRDVSDSVRARKLAKEEQAKIKAIFNSGDHMFWTVNGKTALTSFNEKYRQCIYEIYGQYPEINKDKLKPKKVFASKEYHEFWAQKYQEVFKTGKSVYFQTNTTTKAGNEQFREVFLNPIFDTEDEQTVNEVAGMAIDITDKKRSERLLNEQSNKIKTIFNAAQHMIWSVDCNKTITSFNDYFASKHRERFAVEVKAGMGASDLYKRRNAQTREALLGYYERALNGEKLQFELEFFDKSGHLHAEEIFLSPIHNDVGGVSEIAAISQTVTFKRRAELKLKDQAAKINAIFDSTAMLIWTVDKKMRIVSYNKVFGKRYFKLLGREVSIGDDFSKMLKGAVHADEIKELKGFFEEAFKGVKQQFEGVLRGVDGKKRWMETFLNPIYHENEEVKEISCLSYEVTDKKEIEEQMLESIREKEILLQEVHHRVKNNLQVISSILNLQSAYVKDQNSLDILRESQNRIKSMSFIHESLYQTRDFSQIEFSGYILSLTNNLIHSYSIQAGKINLETDFMKVFLSLDQAIPCGLIINELVSNALKYAYPNQASGAIKLVIKEEKGKIEIRVGDRGIGLPKTLDVENSESLGLQLVYTLIDQLDAQIRIDSKTGTEYLITFDKR